MERPDKWAGRQAGRHAYRETDRQIRLGDFTKIY
jgi:hypothetical protein